MVEKPNLPTRPTFAPPATGDNRARLLRASIARDHADTLTDIQDEARKDLITTMRQVFSNFKSDTKFEIARADDDDKRDVILRTIKGSGRGSSGPRLGSKTPIRLVPGLAKTRENPNGYAYQVMKDSQGKNRVYVWASAKIGKTWQEGYIAIEHIGVKEVGKADAKNAKKKGDRVPDLDLEPPGDSSGSITKGTSDKSDKKEAKEEEKDPIPYGSWVAGKEGFVYSPHARKDQLVDVAGKALGMIVQCPYTYKYFKIPKDAQVTETPETIPETDQFEDWKDNWTSEVLPSLNDLGITGKDDYKSAGFTTTFREGKKFIVPPTGLEWEGLRVKLVDGYKVENGKVVKKTETPTTPSETPEAKVEKSKAEVTKMISELGLTVENNFYNSANNTYTDIKISNKKISIGIRSNSGEIFAYDMTDGEPKAFLNNGTWDEKESTASIVDIIFLKTALKKIKNESASEGAPQELNGKIFYNDNKEISNLAGMTPELIQELNASIDGDHSKYILTQAGTATATDGPTFDVLKGEGLSGGLIWNTGYVGGRSLTISNVSFDKVRNTITLTGKNGNKEPVNFTYSKK